MDEAAFYRELRQDFPELLPDLEDGISTGLLHLEMGELSRLAQDAIAHGNRKTMLRCFSFAARALEMGTPAIRNAVSVSFLEHTLLEPHGEAEREAESLLPPSLKRELVALREYWAEVRARSSSPAKAGASKGVRGRRTRR